MSRRLFRVTFLTSLLFLAACQQVRPPTAVPASSLASTPTLTASFTPTQRSTVTTTATASPTARPSPSVTPTASNTPSASLTPASDLLSQLATAPALPVLEHPSLPTAVLVFQNTSNHLALFDREGQILHTMDKMGIDPVSFNPDEYQVIGPISPVDQTVPLALLSLYNFGQIQIWEHQQYTKKIPAPDIIALKSAPGQPIIAYGTFHPNTGETARSELFLIPVDDPPADPSPLIQAMLPGSYGLYPVAVHARGSTPLGVWLTQQINGIGGWNFDVDRGLAYVDAATGRSIQALPEELVFKGLSPDYRYAAFTAEGKVVLTQPAFQRGSEPPNPAGKLQRGGLSHLFAR